MADDASLLLVEAGLTEVPIDVAKERGPVVTELNLSENAITDCSNLHYFEKLETLVLDKNDLSTLASCPRLSTVKTLWFNNNQVEDLSDFLDELCEKLPNLTMLSLMRNPAAPPLVCVSEEDAAKARRYRLYVSYRLPKLKFLDSAPVTREERAEAQAKGKFLAVRKAQPRSPSAVGEGASPAVRAAIPSVFGGASPTPGTPAGDGAGAGAGAPAASPEDPASATKRKPSAFLGLGSSRYDGRHSEGNRFIVDNDL